MVDFLDEEKQREIFRDRYLHTHGVYLKSIADIIGRLYLIPNEPLCTGMISRLKSATAVEKREDIGGEEPHFRNLRNCWYHECSLNYPSGSTDERMRFAAWKIIECYYAVFSAIAAIVTTSKPERKSHDATLNIFARDFLCNRTLSCYFIPPGNFYLNQQGKLSEDLPKQVNWEYANQYHIPNIVKCLESVRKQNQLATIPHYLKSLRDWVTYGDSYLFIRLFGKSPKSDLAFSLDNITTLFCVEAEHFLLRLYGWDAVCRQYQYFRRQMERSLSIKPDTLIARFTKYENSFR